MVFPITLGEEDTKPTPSAVRLGGTRAPLNMNGDPAGVATSQRGLSAPAAPTIRASRLPGLFTSRSMAWPAITCSGPFPTFTTNGIDVLTKFSRLGVAPQDSIVISPLSQLIEYCDLFRITQFGWPPRPPVKESGSPWDLTTFTCRIMTGVFGSIRWLSRNRICGFARNAQSKDTAGRLPGAPIWPRPTTYRTPSL